MNTVIVTRIDDDKRRDITINDRADKLGSLALILSEKTHEITLSENVWYVTGIGPSKIMLTHTVSRAKAELEKSAVKIVRIIDGKAEAWYDASNPADRQKALEHLLQRADHIFGREAGRGFARAMGVRKIAREMGLPWASGTPYGEGVEGLCNACDGKVFGCNAPAWIPGVSGMMYACENTTCVNNTRPEHCPMDVKPMWLRTIQRTSQMLEAGNAANQERERAALAELRRLGLIQDDEED